MSPSLPLARQQQALLLALFADPGGAQAPSAQARLRPLLAGHPQTDRGLQAYGANAHAMAERALAAAYPVLQALIGTEDFARLARHCWHAHPPQCGDLTQWGESLAALVDAAASLADAPYLGDIARVEWTLHRAATAADGALDAASFTLLTDTDPDRITLVLAPGSALLASPWPVVSVIRAHQSGEPSLAEAGARLRAGVAETALITRAGLRPVLRDCEPAEQVLLRALLGGLSLHRALDAVTAANPCPALDLTAWLQGAVRDGLVLGARLLHHHTPLRSTP